MVAASNQKHLNTFPTVGILGLALHNAAQLLPDIASLKITIILIRIPFLKPDRSKWLWMEKAINMSGQQIGFKRLHKPSGNMVKFTLGLLIWP